MSFLAVVGLLGCSFRFERYRRNVPMLPVGTLVATFSRTQVLGGGVDVAGGSRTTAEIADERSVVGEAFRSTAALAARPEPRLSPSLLSPTRCESRAPKSHDDHVPDTGGMG
jgi:hypothetical protein